ncbi:FG-GAP repeat domain-containing protein [Streptomyces sp. NPDC088923]|uniref:FG-GAP repeat domain-containing protein n=1 Tax=Streptomyces sp. NPDC088923 TaxID=3365913 RepID=UPI00381EF335
MAKSSLDRGKKKLGRFAVAAIAAALVTATAGTAVADQAPAPAARKAAGAVAGATQKATPQGARKASPKARALSTQTIGAAPLLGMVGIDKKNEAWYYGLDGNGGLDTRESLGDFTGVKTGVAVDDDGDDLVDGSWIWDTDGYMWSSYQDGYVGHGWNIYDTLFSPGNLGGAIGSDVLGRDKSGVLWVYLGFGDGRVTGRYRVGGGWGVYTQIAGHGDLTGDGKADIVARDKDGVLWLYKGTGNYKAPFAARTKIGKGWNTYNALVGAGDVDLDGTADLIARDTKGDLYLYTGTGNASAPYATKVKIGHGYHIYKTMFS